MNIAVFLPNWIGDVVMATPALRALRQHFPQARITALLKPYVAGVLEGCPWFDEQILFDKKGPWPQKSLGVAAKLRQRRADVAVLFPNSFRPALVAWLGGCRRRIGYNRYGRNWLLTDRLEPVRDKNGKPLPSPIIDAYNLLVRELDCPNPGYRMTLYTSAQDEQAADDIWQKENLDRHTEIICLNPGAAYGAAKHWPTEYFAALAQKLIDERGCGILVLCGPSEKNLARHVAALTRRDALHTLADYRPSLGLTKACIRRSNLLITTDSGPRHFAAAFDKPVVSLFGPTHIPWTETYHAREICLQKNVPCGPCQLRVCPLDHRCMKELLPAEVYAAAISLLSRFGVKTAPLPGGIENNQETSARKAS